MGMLEALGLRKRPGAVAIRVRESDQTRWVKIGGGLKYNRDMGSADLYDTVDRAFRAWRLNPFVKRITEMWVNYVIGEGLTFTAKDERVQAVLDQFLRRNKVHVRMKKRGREAFLFGELTGIPLVNVATGNTKLAFVDPLQVNKVELDPLDGDNPIAIVVNGKDGQPITLPIVRTDELGLASMTVPELYGDKRPAGFNAPLSTVGRKTGRAFYLAFNSIVGATRGTSDLLTILDWCAGTEDLLWEVRNRTENQNRLFGVIEIKNATPTQLRKYRDKDSPDYIPPPGSNPDEWAYANENITFKFVAPEIGASDIAEAVRMFKSMIEIGGGPPEHFFGQGGDVNYATAKAMDSPFMQQMKSGQQEFCEFWEDVAEFVVDQKLIFTHELDGVTDPGVIVTAPEISAKDERYRAEIAKLFTDTVVAWKTSGWINDVQAIDLMGQIATAAGLKVKAVEAMIPPPVQGQAWAQDALKRISQEQGSVA